MPWASKVIDGFVCADGRLDELDADRASVDARQEDAAAALAREPDQRRGVELFGERGVDRNAQARPQPEHTIDVAGHLSRSLRTKFGGDGATPGAQRLAQRFTFGGGLSGG
jgi:hypothetical protein